ncbi:MAG: DMT family transporter [Planctomycetes bacterium]|nr:DMT family transporter [Planctomycetota bacterium]
MVEDKDAPRPGFFYGWLALAVVIVAWSFPPVLVRFLASDFNTIEQSAFRLVSSTVVMWVYVLLFLRKEFSAFRVELKPTLIATLFIFVYQFSWVTATYFVMPTIMFMILKLNLIFGAIIAYIWEHSEREFIRSKRFIAASALGLAGAVGLVLAGIGSGEEHSLLITGWQGYAIGVALSVVGAFTWPCYSLFAKRIVKDNHPLIAYLYIGTGSTITFCLLVPLSSGSFSSFIDAPFNVQMIVIFSGIICMSMAHAFYMVALKYLGIAVCMLGLLATPVFSYFVGSFRREVELLAVGLRADSSERLRPDHKTEVMIGALKISSNKKSPALMAGLL